MSRYNLNEPHWTPDEEICDGCGNPVTDGGSHCDEGPSEEMDGDHESALASAGFGTDEDYGSFGGEDDWLDGSYEDA